VASCQVVCSRTAVQPRGKMPSDNCHPEICQLGQLPPRTIATQDNYHLGHIEMSTFVAI